MIENIMTDDKWPFPDGRVLGVNEHYERLQMFYDLASKETISNKKIRFLMAAICVTAYTYDKNGNLTYDGVYRYYYDCENRLTDVNNAADAAIVSYKYDFKGRRVLRKAGTNTATYLYDGDQIIADLTGTGTNWRKCYYYGMGIDQPICSEKYNPPDGGTSFLRFYYYDGLGNVVALANYAGTIYEKYTYDVYGKPTTFNASNVPLVTSDVNNRYLFTGREYDPCVGLYYYRARYYNPAIGRFMQSDPVGYEVGMNLYAYVLNDPINWIDPFGLWSQEAHRSLGRCGRSLFDYARLDINFPATQSYGNRRRHFMQLNDAITEVWDAVLQGDRQAFEFSMHEVQDYYSHTAAGYGPRLGHWTHGTDDPTRPENINRYRQADERTRSLEDLWFLFHPEDRRLCCGM
jgi:RHS repeat-associated protein